MNGAAREAVAAADALAALLRDTAVEARLVEPLARFGALVLERNQHVNITAARTPPALVEHLLDSLTVAPFVDGPLVDVGSGGGFPAIPLAIATGVRVVMIESVAKKADFLRGALAALGLDGTVVAERAEVAAHDPALRGHFRTATARAVSGLSTVLELTLPFLAVGGRAVLQRGRLEAPEREAGVDAALMLGGAIVGEELLGASLGSESDEDARAVVDDAPTQRRLVIVEQRRLSAGRFPRRAGVPAKRPLCVPEAPVVRAAGRAR